eukprot:jgi/Chlat1/2203/Chrsp17S02856
MDGEVAAEVGSMRDDIRVDIPGVRRRLCELAASAAAAPTAMSLVVHKLAPERSSVSEVLEAMSSGLMAPEDAALALHAMVQAAASAPSPSSTPSSSMAQVEEFARLDMDRQSRTGFPEVVWGPGKSPDQIAKIMTVLAQKQPLAIATRVDAATAEQLSKMLPSMEYNAVARVCTLQHAARDGDTQDAVQASVSRIEGHIALLSAGTADTAVAEEARVIAQFMGCSVHFIADVGVAGLHRLLSKIDEIRKADVVIVVAGMDGALPSVVAGLVECPVIAVPTSVGYGAAFGGLAPLLSALNACAPGVTVVNIDNGFGAAMAAARFLRSASRLRDRAAAREPPA